MPEYNHANFLIVRDLDVEKARPLFRAQGFKRMFKKDGSLIPEDEVILAGLHKARTAAPGVHRSLVAISKRWLKENGYG